MGEPSTNEAIPSVRKAAPSKKAISLSPDYFLEHFGIVTHTAETYSVGGYRYTNLADAIAQAQRMNPAAMAADAP